MLLTMEAEYKRKCEVFPSPERIAKVRHSLILKICLLAQSRENSKGRSLS